MSKPSVLRDYLMLHFIVLIWGFTAILGVLISIPTVEMVLYRTLMASLILGFIFWWRKTKIRIPKREFLKILGTGIIIAIHWLLFFGAARVSNISVCLAGLATSTFWTALIEPMVKRTQIKWYEILLGLMVICGLVIIFSFELDYWLGFVMSIVSAFLGALFMVIIVYVWKNLGYCAVVFLAGLQSIPKELIEAATIDRAGPVRRFFSITLPLLTPTVFFLLVTNIIFSMTNAFDILRTMTPTGHGTNTIIFEIYLQSFGAYQRAGYSAAIAVVLFFTLFLITAVQLRYVERKVHYQ